MKKFIEYIDSCLPEEVFKKVQLRYNRKLNKYVFKNENTADTLGEKIKSFFKKVDVRKQQEHMSKMLFNFKRKVLDEMNNEFKVASSRGVCNDDVFSDLVISNHGDLKGDFEKFCSDKITEEKTKRKVKNNIIGSVVYILALVAVFLFISFKTQAWATTWLIMVNGILIWVSYLLSLGIIKISKLRRIFHIFARILLAIDIMTLSVAAFLYSLTIMHNPNSWLIVISGIAAMFVSDGIYIAVKKQKLAILNFLAYIPAFCSMLFIILSAAGITPWNKGWLLVIAGVVIDAIIAIGSLIRNKKYEREVYSSWNED